MDTDKQFGLLDKAFKEFPKDLSTITWEGLYKYLEDNGVDNEYISDNCYQCEVYDDEMKKLGFSFDDNKNGYSKETKEIMKAYVPHKDQMSFGFKEEIKK